MSTEPTTVPWPQWPCADIAALARFVQPRYVYTLLPGLGIGASDRPARDRLRDIYTAFADYGITYAHESVYSAEGHQAITPPDEVLQGPKWGNCLDLSLLFAAACLDAGLHPMLVITRDPSAGTHHALVAVCLGPSNYRRNTPAEDYPLRGQEPVHWDAPEALTGHLAGAADGDGTFLAVDVAAAASHDGTAHSFDQAVARGTAFLTAAPWQWGVGLDIAESVSRLDPADRHRPPPMPEDPALTDPYVEHTDHDRRPLTDLGARFGIVPYVPRRELDALLDWCESTDDVQGLRVARLEAPGGAGKTRLAAELCKRLRDRNLRWQTGFLNYRDEVTRGEATDGVWTEPQMPPVARTGIDWLASRRGPLLIVVDYPEVAKTRTVRHLLEALSQRREGPTCVLFTGRNLQHWWDEQIQNELARYPRVEPLRVLDTQPPHPLPLYRRAFAAFAARHRSGAPTPDRIPDGRWPTTLDLVMLAWVEATRAASSPPQDRREVLEIIVREELKAWQRAIEQQGGRLSGTALRRAAVLLALLGPSPDRLEHLLTAPVFSEATGNGVDEEWRGGVCDGIARIVPAHPETGGLAVQPDLLASHLLATAFDPERPGAARGAPGGGPWQELLADALDLADEQEYAHACTMITYTGDTDPDTAQHMAEIALSTPPQGHRDEAPPVRWEVPFTIAESRGGPFLPVLERLAEAEPSPLPLRELANLPPESTYLRSIALTATLRTPPESAEDLDGRAIWLNNLANRLSSVGRRAEALEAADESVRLHRTMVAADAAAYRPKLASGLVNLGIRQFEASLSDEGLRSMEEAIGLYRSLDESNALAYRPLIAAALSNLSVGLAETGRPDEAFRAAEEAVALHRSLADADSGTYAGPLAASLSNLCIRLSDMGFVDEALRVAAEVVEIRRPLAEANPGAHQPQLAGSLRNLGACLEDVGHLDEALETGREAVQIYRSLAASHPAAYRFDLLVALNNHSGHLAGVGPSDGALAVIEEAVLLGRELTELDPGAHQAALAMTLHNHGARLAQVGRLKEALKSVEEAVSLYRSLATSHPTGYHPKLAVALGGLGVRLASVGRSDESLAVTEEAVLLGRELTELDPGAHQATLAAALDHYGARLSEAGLLAEALQAAEETVRLHRSLAETHPEAHQAALATALTNLGIHLAEAGRLEESLRASAEAVRYYRTLAQTIPDAYRAGLAEALSNHSRRLFKVGRLAEALQAAEETVRLHRSSAEPYRADLALSLNNLGQILSQVGRPDESLQAVTEAVDIHRALAGTEPDRHQADLAASLNNLGQCLAEAGQSEAALDAVEEAVRLRRSLAEAHPDAHRADLTQTLNHYGARLAASGRLDEALRVAKEAVAAYRSLAEAHPGAYRAAYGAALNNLSLRLSQAGRSNEALRAAEESVAIFRSLAEANPDAYRSNLAAALNGHGLRLSDAGLRNAAIRAAEEATDIHQSLAAAHPDAFFNDLTMALGNLSSYYTAAQRHREDLARVHAAAAALSPVRAAELWVRRAGWDTGDPPSDLAEALSRLDGLPDSTPGLSRVRRMIRTAYVGRAEHLPLAAGPPFWLTTSIAPELMAHFQAWRETPIGAGRATFLREHHEALLAYRDSESLAAIQALFADLPAVSELALLVDMVGDNGIEAVLSVFRSMYNRLTPVQQWLTASDWEQSRLFAIEHVDAITDPGTRTFLEARSPREDFERHLAIWHLIDLVVQQSGCGSAEAVRQVYDWVLEPVLAAEPAVAAIQRGDGRLLGLLGTASPELWRLHGVGHVLQAVAIVLTADGGLDQAEAAAARHVQTAIAEYRRRYGDSAARHLQAHSRQLRDCGRARFDRASALEALANFLDANDDV